MTQKKIDDDSFIPFEDFNNSVKISSNLSDYNKRINTRLPSSLYEYLTRESKFKRREYVLTQALRLRRDHSKLIMAILRCLNEVRLSKDIVVQRIEHDCPEVSKETLAILFGLSLSRLNSVERNLDRLRASLTIDL